MPTIYRLDISGCQVPSINSLKLISEELNDVGIFNNFIATNNIIQNTLFAMYYPEGIEDIVCKMLVELKHNQQLQAIILDLDFNIVSWARGVLSWHQLMFPSKTINLQDARKDASRVYRSMIINSSEPIKYIPLNNDLFRFQEYEASVEILGIWGEVHRIKLVNNDELKRLVLDEKSILMNIARRIENNRIEKKRSSLLSVNSARN